MPLSFAKDSVLVKEAAFWPVPAPGQLDTATRVVWNGEVQYRLVWELDMGGGRSIHQYTRNGGTIFQVYLQKLHRRGVRRIIVYDFLRPRSHGPVYSVDVPAGAKVDVIYNCEIVLHQDGRTPTINRVYTFGWEGEGRCAWHHLEPVRVGHFDG